MTQPTTSQTAYKFVKVEDFFADYKSWQKLEKVNSHDFNAATQTLSLEFVKADGNFCIMMIHFVQKDTFRVRFNPAIDHPSQYAMENTSSVYMDKFDDLRTALSAGESFEIEDCTQSPRESINLLVRSNGQAVMRLVVNYAPFQMTVFNCEMGDSELKIWQTTPTGIYFAANGSEDYSIIQAVNKPATARYLGFGEQGGQSLYKNTAQVTYFNYDNMRYRQVYNYGPLDGREPLYHSDPFFVEFNAIPDQDCVTGIFIDNPSQVCVDVGYLNSSRYMFGTRFGDLDYYFFLGDDFAEIVDGFTSIVGRSELKPRYSLGYHQGCYGYEDRGSLEWAVNKYRDYSIPLDGLHVDVDVQDNYRTFTIDEGKFPNPKEMFANLRSKGIKCSTNITPIVSNQDKDNPAYYSTYQEGLEKGYFVLDIRQDPHAPETWQYQDFNSGWESHYPFTDPEGNFNSGNPYIGEVYYGQDYRDGRSLGSTGHYPDLARGEVRQWWGKQYQYLFDMGLEFVWQDMTTPAIRPTRGDMRSFPFELLINSDFYANIPEGQFNLIPAIKVWNLFSYNLHKATYHGLDRLPGRENKRNFIVGRGSFAGMHRYAALWTGDNSSTWDFLKMNVSQALSLGMCGMVMSGQDIGGFEAEDNEQHWVGPELLIRWTAAGAFLPWFRNHYMRKGRKYFQEPFMYEEWFNQYRDGNIPEPQDLYRSVLPICKYYIELRYRLMQLFYDAMFENTLNGQPICRPMFLTDPSDKALYNDKRTFLDNQFLVRGDFLVAPVLEPQSDSNGYGRRDVYLPATNDWYCFMNNRQPLTAAIEGGTTIHFDAHIAATPEHINFVVPMYVRAGAVLPTIEVEQYVGERNAQGLANPLTFNIYPGKTKIRSESDRQSLPQQSVVGLTKTVQKPYTMYLDDGVSRSSAATKHSQASVFAVDQDAKDEYRQVEITNYPPEAGDKTRVITIQRTWDGYTPQFETYFFVAILHDPMEAQGNSGSLKQIKILRNGADAQFLPLMSGNSTDQAAANLNDSTQDAWYYNQDLHISFVKVFDNAASIAMIVEYV